MLQLPTKHLFTALRVILEQLSLCSNQGLEEFKAMSKVCREVAFCRKIVCESVDSLSMPMLLGAKT